jgi:hypothetical protein
LQKYWKNQLHPVELKHWQDLLWEKNMKNARDRSTGLTVIGTILLLFAVGTIAFWIVFFTSGAVSVSTDAAYLAHERSFPLADMYMAVAAIIAAIGLFRRRSWGLLFGVMAGSGIIFLGLMDILYALEQGIFRDSVLTILICAACLIIGPVSIAYIWIKRHELGMAP